VSMAKRAQRLTESHAVEKAERRHQRKAAKH
jgi:hypothetical protein